MSTLALAAALTLGGVPDTASALSIGRLVVQSALGEPLRAEINILDINAEEAASLKAGVASAEAFRAAGIEYSTVLSGLQITLQRRADGRPVLQLTGSRPVNEPFIDLILEASWASGRLVRDYTLLLDPPNLRTPAPAAPAAQLPAAPQAPAAPQEPRIAPQTRTAAPPAPPDSRPAAPPSPVPPAPAAAPAANLAQVKVKPGDTAGRIARANKPTTVSLDQMLVALLRTNPDAFVRGNIHRLKAGAVLDMPDAAQAESVPPAGARETVLAQSRDFNEYRRKLAGIAPVTPVAAADRQAAGKVDARAQEPKPATASPDKLTLSKGGVAAKSAEDTLAKDMARKEATARLAELSKNIKDLNKLGAAAPAASAASTPAPATQARNPATAASVAAPAPMPAAPASAPASAPAPAPAPTLTPASTSPAATQTAPAGTVTTALPTAPAAAASAVQPPATPAPSPEAPKKPAPPPPPPPPEPSFLDDLMDNPMVLAAAGGLVALLAGLGIYRQRRAKKASTQDSSFLESRLQPDSFFGASGGQKVDTNESTNDGSSMMYSPSQLDAAGDVDPVAEADVYLAYGRDLQAEEILKEALRINPSRIALHGKLLEIYAKRRDTRAFESVATDAYNITMGEGGVWTHICEMGRELDPANALYQPGGQPASRTPQATAPISAFTATTVTQAHESSAEGIGDSALDLDLDLDFSLDTPSSEQPEAPHAPQNGAPGEPTVALSQSEVGSAQGVSGMDLDMSMDFDLPPAPEPAPMAALDLPDLDLSSPAEPSHLDTPPLTTDLGDAQTDAPMLEGFELTEAPAVANLTPSSTQADQVLGDLGLDFNLTPEPEPPVSAPAGIAQPEHPEAPSDEFDVQDLSFDLGDTPSELTTDSGLMPPPPEDNPDDPLGTKLALAQEFHAIGDAEGARSLAEEVLAEATGNLKIRAQRFLGELG